MPMSEQKKQELWLNTWVRANKKEIKKLMENPALWEKALRLVGLR